MSIKNPILLDLPTPINTERLILRALLPREGLHVFEAVDESRNYLKQWLPWVDELSLSRRYVRFDSQGLEGWQVKW